MREVNRWNTGSHKGTKQVAVVPEKKQAPKVEASAKPKQRGIVEKVRSENVRTVQHEVKVQAEDQSWLTWKTGAAVLGTAAVVGGAVAYASSKNYWSEEINAAYDKIMGDGASAAEKIGEFFKR